ncbi:MAG: FHA domain-containing protein [Labilithrix sp.]|nr:FHA domain-containing protein [Labilithrix sp.]MCW5812769.1 FHA domain-containing protein [Labilithrix sp.]
MDLWSDHDEEHAPCCGACASIGDEPPLAGATFRYDASERLVIRARSRGETKEYAVTKEVVVVGRAQGRVDLVLPDSVISRVQCRFVFAHGVVEVEDMRSTCGTAVGGEMITRTTLREGDVVRVGDSELEVRRA